MRRIALIAWHDFWKYVTRRGFLIGILLFPVWIFAFVAVPQLLQRSKDTRYFVVADLSGGGYRAAIARELDRADARRTLIALASFARAAIDLKAYEQSAPDAVRLLRGDPYDPAALETYTELGGWQAIVETLASRGASALRAFKPPRAPFALLETPADLNVASSDMAAAVRPYLTGRSPRLAGSHKLSAVLVVPADFAPGVAADYWNGAGSDSGLDDFLQGALTVELRLRAGTQLTSDGAAMLRVLRLYATVTARTPEAEPSSGRGGSLTALIGRFLPIALAYILFLSAYGNALFMLGSVVEEKATRMVEILVSCATPIEIMSGKLIAGIATSLVSFVLWGSGLVLLAFLLWPGMGSFVVEALKAFAALDTAPFILVYFISGLLIYGAVFLAIGSMAASVADAQALAAPANFVMFFPNFFIPLFISDPGSVVVKVMSWIPIYTPTFMLVRLPANPPLDELWITAILCVVTAIVLMRWMAHVFAANLLTTERPPQFGKLLARWFGRRA